MCDVNQCLSIFLMFWYYAYGEIYFELVQIWLNFLEERRIVVWGRGMKVAFFIYFWRETVEQILTVHELIREGFIFVFGLACKRNGESIVLIFSLSVFWWWICWILDMHNEFENSINVLNVLSIWKQSNIDAFFGIMARVLEIILKEGYAGTLLTSFGSFYYDSVSGIFLFHQVGVNIWCKLRIELILNANGNNNFFTDLLKPWIARKSLKLKEDERLNALRERMWFHEWYNQLGSLA